LLNFVPYVEVCCCQSQVFTTDDDQAKADNIVFVVDNADDYSTEGAVWPCCPQTADGVHPG